MTDSTGKQSRTFLLISIATLIGDLVFLCNQSAVIYLGSDIAPISLTDFGLFNGGMATAWQVREYNTKREQRLVNQGGAG